jgi:hypothetical protein
MAVILADGFEEAYIGQGRQANRNFAVYDYDKCLAILMKRENWSLDDAVEWMEYNVVGAWVGDQTPIFVETGIKIDELDE